MKKLFLLVGTALFCLTGCSTVHQSTTSASLNESVAASHRAHIRVGEKISGESSLGILFGFIKVGGDNHFIDGVTYGGSNNPLSGIYTSDMDQVKSAAAYKAVTKSGADVIVAPTYKTYIDDYLIYKRLAARVVGYKGTITGFSQTH